MEETPGDTKNTFMSTALPAKLYTTPKTIDWILTKSKSFTDNVLRNSHFSFADLYGKVL